MSKTLRLNVNYIILFKIPKNQLSQIYIDQPININKELFYKIISELNKYENIIIVSYTIDIVTFNGDK